jgi:hypothetical protein
MDQTEGGVSEDEYVKFLRDRAEAYIAFVRQPSEDNVDGIRLWWTAKESLSAHTMIRLCDHWLNRGPARTETLTGHREKTAASASASPVRTQEPPPSAPRG